MKRMPRWSSSLRSLSSGSMTTKRFLSYAKWRSIRGRVPLPIEPKPIITIGLSIRACTGHLGIIEISRKGRQMVERRRNGRRAKQARRPRQCAILCCGSGDSGTKNRLGGRTQQPAGALERVRDKLEGEQAVPFEGARHAQGRGYLCREAEPAVIRCISDEDDGAVA